MECWQWALILLGAFLIKWAVWYVSLRVALHRGFGEGGRKIVRIDRFRGFIGFRSGLEAMTSKPLVVSFISGGEAEEVICVVRFVPIVGYVWAAEGC